VSNPESQATNIAQNGKELPRYEVEKLDLEIIGSSNDTKFFENPAKPPSFETSSQSPLFLVEQMVPLTLSSSSPRLNRQLHGKLRPEVNVQDTS
jgi:hypothetical protein